MRHSKCQAYYPIFISCSQTGLAFSRGCANIDSSVGDSPSGKAVGSGPTIRGFESLIPSQNQENMPEGLYFFDFLLEVVRLYSGSPNARFRLRNDGALFISLIPSHDMRIGVKMAILSCFHHFCAQKMEANLDIENLTI